MACADRVSDKISGVQHDSLQAAARHAGQIGSPLNVFLTIHWENADGSGDVRKRNSHMLECARHWLGRRGAPLAAIWAIERGAAGSGLHAHNLIHIPLIPRRHLRDFAAMLPDWVPGAELIPREQWPKGKKRHTVAVGGPTLFSSPVWQIDRIHDRANLVNYVLKGTWGRSSAGVTYQYQGEVTGKRCGMSNNLGPTARARYQKQREVA